LLHADPGYATIIATAITTKLSFMRQKIGGVWGIWTEIAGEMAGLDTRYVNSTGDSMTGTLVSGKTIGAIAAAANYAMSVGIESAGAAGDAAYMTFHRVGAYAAHFGIDTDNKWKVGGFSAGSNSYEIWHAGNFTPGNYLPLTGGRLTGPLQVSAPSPVVVPPNSQLWITANGAMSATVPAGRISIGLDGNPDYGAYLGAMYDPASVHGVVIGGRFGGVDKHAIKILAQTGAVSVLNDLTAPGKITGGTVRGQLEAVYSTVGGTVYFGSDLARYITNDGTRFVAAGTDFHTGSNLAVNGGIIGGNGGALYLRPVGIGSGTGDCLAQSNGYFTAQMLATKSGVVGGLLCKEGTASGNGVNYSNFYWDGSQHHAYVDQTHLGTLSFVSDYRIKKDVIDLPSTWDAVKALRPIKYTQAQFTPPGQIKAYAKESLRVQQLNEENKGIEGYAQQEVKEIKPLFAADDIERWGFIAHELQETLTMSASTGAKDAPSAVQSPNPWTVIAALTKVVQELQARVETLEGVA